LTITVLCATLAVSSGVADRKRDDEMSDANVLQVPQDILDSARLTISELKVEMAIYLYAQGRLSIGKARELADMSLWEFRQLLASHRISPHYDERDLDEDIATLREMGRL
jgi:predicted HTH domain antitoxin